MAQYDMTAEVKAILDSGVTREQLDSESRAATGRPLLYGYTVGGRTQQEWLTGRAAAAQTADIATARQVQYLIALGADAAMAASLSKAEASAEIGRRKPGAVSPVAQARLHGLGLGVRTEIWDNA